MSSTQTVNEQATGIPTAAAVDLKLEVVPPSSGRRRAVQALLRGPRMARGRGFLQRRRVAGGAADPSRLTVLGQFR
jgi:hypothetical protein